MIRSPKKVGYSGLRWVFRAWGFRVRFGCRTLAE